MNVRELIKLIKEDYMANRLQGESDSPLIVITIRFQSVFLFRISQYLDYKSKFLSGAIKTYNQIITGADLAPRAKIQGGLILFHPSGCVIGPYVKAGHSLSLQQGVTLGGLGNKDSSKNNSPTLGDRITIGAGAKIFGPVKIDDNCFIGANSVVNKSFKSNSIIAGVPAKKINSLKFLV